MEKGYALIEVDYELYEDDGETSAEIVPDSESIEEFTLDPTDWDDEPSDHAEVRLLAKLLRYDGILEPSSSHMGPGDWFMRRDEDIRTGGWTEVSVHPKGFSKSEWALLVSLLSRKR